MQSRKMVLKILFTGQKWRNRHREQTYEHGEMGGEDLRYEDVADIHNGILHIQKMDQIVPFSET